MSGASDADGAGGDGAASDADSARPRAADRRPAASGGAGGSTAGDEATERSTATVPETAVPPEETPAAVCPYCDRPFRLARACALHVVQDHPREHTPAERDAYEAARDEEDDDLFVYHLKVVAAISILYTVSILGYMVVLGAG